MVRGRRAVAIAVRVTDVRSRWWQAPRGTRHSTSGAPGRGRGPRTSRRATIARVAMLAARIRRSAPGAGPTPSSATTRTRSSAAPATTARRRPTRPGRGGSRWRATRGARRGAARPARDRPRCRPGPRSGPGARSRGARRRRSPAGARSARTPPPTDSPVCRSKIVVRMSLITLSSSSTTSRRLCAGRAGDARQHGAQPHARAEHPLDDQVVEVPGDAVALLRHLERAQLSSRLA